MGGLGLGGLWLVLLLVIGASIGVACGSVWLANRTAHRSGDDDLRGSLSPFLTTVALVYGALLGFTVVVAWEQFSSAEANVTNESSTLATMYRQTVSMSAPEQEQMRTLLRAYTTAAQDEWDSQGNSAASGTARAAITDMYRVLSGPQSSAVAENPINAEIRDQLTTLTSQRNTRVLDAKPRIPGLLWGGLLFGGALLIGLIGFTRLDSVRYHMVLSSAISILLGLLLLIIYWLDHPFGRELGVTPATFDYTIQVFDGVDGGS